MSRAFGDPMKAEEQATMPFSGGIMQHGYQCGMIWGAAIAAGARAHRLLGQGPQAETRTILAARRLVESFRALNEHVDCFEITDIDRSSSTSKMITYFLIRGGTIGCFRMAARYAPVAFREIESALSEKHVEAPPAPASCSALLARRMGVSDKRVVMTAGLAGGIGLSGGACGALGAAVWVIGLRAIEEGGKVEFKDPRLMETVDGFMRCTDFEIECSAIVGRRFEDVHDHAAYLREGGCSRIIEELAAR